ncbi:TetR/AcrR family transcriptional regulator [Peribacillus deserti]|uniref:TetR/AcrR family transcriptional regulator n=1 Tax=Peribacillus deserti TaxID=673318 RepID=A0A2N5MA82_9BACI|nr:TetR/AcrR family transcriptional regulator [Peribacillus deserti]PLT31282.1 TetR/AcrR family transcriptional regulator [Peribacillus deserti]
MKDRKQHVIKMAHQLFIEKGYQATSIQDILDHSGISKGTFYNYFSSKTELLIALFKSLFKQLEKERNDLLTGQDPANIDIFIKQIELQMRTNRTNKLISLFEEVIVSNDADLKQYMNQGHLKMLRWIYSRFIDIFGEDKKPCLLDCAIMFLGILKSTLRYDSLTHDPNRSIHQVVRYSVERVAATVQEVSKTSEILFHAETLDNLLPPSQKNDQMYRQALHLTVADLKKDLPDKDKDKYLELLDFVQDELLHTRSPRKFLIESALLSLKGNKVLCSKQELQKLAQLTADYFNQMEFSE